MRRITPDLIFTPLRRIIFRCLTPADAAGKIRRSVVVSCKMLALVGLLVPSTGSPVVASEIRILIDTETDTLQVMNGDAVIRSFANIAIGRYGKTYFKVRGDNKTPLGKFRIGWKNGGTRYHRFLGLTYPDLPAADRALVDGRIDEPQWQAIRRASEAGKVPSQKTPLGGMIGIHGIGAGDRGVHRDFNWTNGCVALTNEEIEELLQWVKIGTPVEIR
jgi:lipoprotein-anchoring transpeptidase ErfK/SrfK